MQVLFLCPHGAAKSVIAAALFRDLARNEGREIKALSAGTDPDDEINPLALSQLRARQLDFPDEPQLVTPDLIYQSDVVVSLGCSVDELPAPPPQWVDWCDAPGVSDDADGLFEMLTERLPILFTFFEPRSCRQEA